MTDGPPRKGEFRSGALTLRFVEWGRADAPPIILLHGLRSYAMTWELAARRLSAHFRMIALDQRGRGDSDWEPERNYYTHAYVEDLEALVAHLGIDSFVLIGHSLGGANALVYAARHPERVRALVIEDIGPGSSSSTEGAKRIVHEIESTPSRFDNWEAARRFWRSKRPDISEAALDSRVEYTLKQDANGAVVWKYDAEGIGFARLELARRPELSVDLWPAVDSIRCPTLVIRGDRSDFLPRSTVQAMCRRNPNMTSSEIRDAGHYVHDDNGDAFVVVLGDFLAKLEAGSRASCSS